MPADLAQAVHTYLARTPCKVMVVQLEDVMGVETPVNVPGTMSEYPSWQRKLPVSLEDSSGGAALDLLTAALRGIRGSGSRAAR
jgi:(1->4)-alpha-D-glucan 1-alpha-D-glucosylmutase